MTLGYSPLWDMQNSNRNSYGSGSDTTAIFYSSLTQIILIIARWRHPIHELRLRFGEEGGKAEREGNSPLTSQASHCWGGQEEKKKKRSTAGIDHLLKRSSFIVTMRIKEKLECLTREEITKSFWSRTQSHRCFHIFWPIRPQLRWTSGGAMLQLRKVM